MRATIPRPAPGLASDVALARSPKPAEVADTAEGKVLADTWGVRLSTFGRDTAGTPSRTGRSDVRHVATP